MKNKLLILIFTVAFMAFVSTKVEARHSRVYFNVGVNSAYPTYVVRQPVVVAPAPVIVNRAPVVMATPGVSPCQRCHPAPVYVVQSQPVVVSRPVIVSPPAYSWGISSFGFSFRL